MLITWLLCLVFCRTLLHATVAGEQVVNAMDSDYLHLDLRPTSLPFPVGNGVFAKFDIPAGEILCEYRGPVISQSVSHLVQSDKLFNIELPENGDMKTYFIMGKGICAYINDCANILGQRFTEADLDNLQLNESAEISPYPGYEYNARYLRTALGKVFISSIKDIKANSEIFFSYGK